MRGGGGLGAVDFSGEVRCFVEVLWEVDFGPWEVVDALVAEDDRVEALVGGVLVLLVEAVGGDLRVEVAQNRVVFQQVGQRGRVGSPVHVEEGDMQ